MIDPRTKLTVLHDDNSSFTDNTNKAADYTRDTFTHDLIAAEDYLYIGYTKPFAYAYVELETANTNANTFTAEVYDGTSWVDASMHDSTMGFTRSGYLEWDKSDMDTTTVNSLDRYWLRLKPSADHSSTVYRGINLVFSEDAAMKAEFFEIDNSNLLPTGESSHITTHVAARNTIIQQLRSQGYIKDHVTTGEANINQWDLHDIYEIRQGATHLALSKIFFNLSDSVDDNWWQKYKEYQDKYEESMRLAKLTLDLDDDGAEDTDEKVKNAEPFRWDR